MAPPNEPADGELIDEEEGEEAPSVSPKEILGFVLRAVRLRWKTSVAVFVSIAGLAVAANALLPRTYHCDVRIHAQGNAAIIRALNIPGRMLPDAESATKGAADTLLRQESLEKIARDARLVERWDRDRPPLLRFKDRMMGMLTGPISEADKEKLLIGLLEKKISVQPEDQAVNIGVDWSSAAAAFELATVAQKSFIDSRRAIEVAVISDAITILEARANEERPAVDAALKDVQAAFDLVRGKTPASAEPAPPSTPTPDGAPAPPPRPRPVAAPVAARAEPDKELIEKLAEKRRQIADMEQARQRRIADVKAQVEEQRSTLGAAHPTLIASEKRLETVSEESPDLIAAKNEERALLRQVNTEIRDQAAAVAPRRPTSGYVAPASTGAAPAAPKEREGSGIRPDEDPRVGFARGRFENAFKRYEEMMGNLDAARTELDTAKAAFKYRYSIARPPEMPSGAIKPKPLQILGGGFGAAFLFALLIPAALRFATGRVQEPWQVRSQLKLPVLGEVKLPSK